MPSGVSQVFIHEGTRTNDARPMGLDVVWSISVQGVAAVLDRSPDNDVGEATTSVTPFMQ